MISTITHRIALSIILVVLGSHVAESFDRSIQADLDDEVSRLVRAMSESKVISEEVAGGLELELDKPVLYDVADSAYDSSHLRAIDNAIRAAVGKTRRDLRPLSPAGIEALVLDSGIAVLETNYPPIVVSETEERSALSVRLWVCPDRISAVALFWIRRGGSLPDNSDVVRSRGISSTHHNLLQGDDVPGELAYSYSIASSFNAPLEKGDEMAGGDRMGFIRKNLVIEVSTWTYVRLHSTGKWVTLGMMDGGSKEATSIMKDVDSFIQMENARF